MISFDFDAEHAAELIRVAPLTLRTKLVEVLNQFPFGIQMREPLFFVNIKARLSDQIQSNEDGDFLPLIVTNFSS